VRVDGSKVYLGQRNLHKNYSLICLLVIKRGEVAIHEYESHELERVIR
jgi:hypothetical protein